MSWPSQSRARPVPDSLQEFPRGLDIREGHGVAEGHHQLHMRMQLRRDQHGPEDLTLFVWGRRQGRTDREQVRIHGALGRQGHRLGGQRPARRAQHLGGGFPPADGVGGRVLQLPRAIGQVGADGVID